MHHASSDLAESLGVKYKHLESARYRFTELYNQRQINGRFLDTVYEGLFLNSYVVFEGFLEKLFIKLLITNKDPSFKRSEIVPKIVVKSPETALKVIFGPNRSYTDWLPYKHTIKLAEIYFRNGIPFTELGDDNKTVLQRSHVIRNAIAHSSRASMENFEKVIIGSTPLPKSERYPAGYLKGYFRTNPLQTRYEYLVSELLSIARFLAR